MFKDCLCIVDYFVFLFVIVNGIDGNLRFIKCFFNVLLIWCVVVVVYGIDVFEDVLVKMLFFECLGMFIVMSELIW